MLVTEPGRNTGDKTIPIQPRPTKVRYGVLAFLFALSVITYFDRVCISVAAPYIMDQLSLSPVAMSFVFSAFTLAYSIFEVPSGWLGDRFGARKALTRIVLWWSALTMLTAVAWSFASLLVLRFLFGAGEAGAFPNISRSLSNWFPASERGRAYGLVFMGTRIGGALAPPIVAGLIIVAGWRWAFVTFGVVGPIWAVLWYRWYRDHPASHNAVSGSEMGIIRDGGGAAERNDHAEGRQSVPWRLVASNPNLILLCAIYFCVGYGLYFYLTWLPSYLEQVRGFSILSSGFLASLPLLFGAVTNVAGGWIMDNLSNRYSLRASRCAIGAIGLFGSAVAITCVALTDRPVAAALMVAVAAGSADLALPASWAVCSDLSLEHAGVVTGFMNTLGNIGGTIGPLATGFMVGRLGSWRLPFFVTGLMYLTGAVLWLKVHPGRPLLTSFTQELTNGQPKARS
jgi:ACS family glucarate transporter-like MFS transporter